jgi:hypothetical protein
MAKTYDFGTKHARDFWNGKLVQIAGNAKQSGQAKNEVFRTL